MKSFRLFILLYFLFLWRKLKKFLDQTVDLLQALEAFLFFFFFFFPSNFLFLFSFSFPNGRINRTIANFFRIKDISFVHWVKHNSQAKAILLTKALWRHCESCSKSSTLKALDFRACICFCFFINIGASPGQRTIMFFPHSIFNIKVFVLIIIILSSALNYTTSAVHVH